MHLPRIIASSTFIFVYTLSGRFNGTRGVSIEERGLTVVHGVALAQLALYQPSSTNSFTCLEEKGKIFIPYTQLNDDYCDCPDGSDEPGTPACSHRVQQHFHCNNNHEKLSHEIHASRIRDGRCDCCDGSDEMDLSTGITPCDNTCIPHLREAKQVASIHLEKVRKGILVRNERIEEWKKVEASFQPTLDISEMRLTDAQRIKRRVQSYLRLVEKEEIQLRINKAVGMYVAPVDERKMCSEEEKEENQQCSADTTKSSTKQRKDMKMKTLDQIMRQSEIQLMNGDVVSVEKYMDFKLSALESATSPTVLHRRQNGFMGPVINNGEEGWIMGATYILQAIGIILSPIRGVWELLILTQSKIGSVWQSIVGPRFQMEDFVQLSSVNSIIPWESFNHLRVLARPYFYGRIGKTYSAAAWAFSVMWNAPLSLWDIFFPDLDQMFKHPEAESLRDVLKSIDEVMQDIKKERDHLIAAFGRKYGENNSFYTLKDRCFSTVVDKYTYQVCPFHNVTQDNVRLGICADGEEVEQPIFHFICQGGNQCYNGPARSTNVSVVCGDVDAILDVAEPDKCQYTMTFSTPSACTNKMLTEAESEHAVLKDVNV